MYFNISERIDNMKKLCFALAAVLSVTLLFTGCGKKSDPTAGMSEADKLQYQVEHFAEDADKSADSSKIDGTKATTADGSDKGKGTINEAYKVSIDNLVVTTHEDRTVAIVDFTFKNNSTQPVNFSGAINVLASQNGMELTPAIFQTELEGYSPNTIMQSVEKGEKITVQKAFSLTDAETPVEIQLSTYTDTVNNLVTKIFDIK